jgi:hypothetical protein
MPRVAMVLISAHRFWLNVLESSLQISKICISLPFRILRILRVVLRINGKRFVSPLPILPALILFHWLLLKLILAL